MERCSGAQGTELHGKLCSFPASLTGFSPSSPCCAPCSVYRDCLEALTLIIPGTRNTNALCTRTYAHTLTHSQDTRAHTQSSPGTTCNLFWVPCVLLKNRNQAYTQKKKSKNQNNKPKKPTTHPAPNPNQTSHQNIKNKKQTNKRKKTQKGGGNEEGSGG